MPINLSYLMGEIRAMYTTFLPTVVSILSAFLAYVTFGNLTVTLMIAIVSIVILMLLMPVKTQPTKTTTDIKLKVH